MGTRSFSRFTICPDAPRFRRSKPSRTTDIFWRIIDLGTQGGILDSWSMLRTCVVVFAHRIERAR